MLKSLTIRNVALISAAHIEFFDGLNVLSGETGAGKSVILDALNFVLGAKADRTMIGRGGEECLVSAAFQVHQNHAVKGVLESFGLPFEGDIIIHRKYDINGRGDIRINGFAAAVNMLREIAANLVDVHGQSEHFFLLKESNQLLCLDKFIDADSVKAELKVLTAKLKGEYKNAEKYSITDEERGRRADILKFQIGEIERADIKEGEEQSLTTLRKKFNSYEKILSAFSAAKELIDGEGGGADALNRALHEIESVSQLDKDYESAAEVLRSAKSELDEAGLQIGAVLDNFEYDAEGAARCESRLDEIRALHKKYGKDLAEINKFLDAARAEYEALSNYEKAAEESKRIIERLEKEVYLLCLTLTKKRKDGAELFKRAVTDELHELNMKNAKFDIAFKEYDRESVKYANENGLDSVSFLFSANKGEPVLPLSKVISGGEMSRFMLALKTQTVKANEISSFVFDEIDAGISGNTAAVVAQKFAKIALTSQIIAVTHLPQIAAMSDGQYLIEKTEEKDRTTTEIISLDRAGKLMEVVRLLGGNLQSQAAIDHANQLISAADSFKNSLSRCI